MTTVQWVGGTPIGQVVWDQFSEHQANIVDLCLQKEKLNTVESNVGTSIKTNLWESTFDFLQHPALIELNDWMHRSTSEFVSSINKKTYHTAITESWAHVTRPAGFHGPHRHPWSTWSGIFYVYADTSNLAGNTFFNQFTMPKVAGYDFFEEEFEVPFTPGLLVIFPSTIMHYAKPYLGNDKRIVIAFNSVCI